MADQGADEGFLLAILNSTPVVDGVPTDDLADPARARAWLASAGGSAPRRNCGQVHIPACAAGGGARSAAAGRPRPGLAGGDLARHRRRPPHLDAQRPGGTRTGPAGRADWDALAKNSPGRLRPCANDECRLFLIDRSKAGTARWCSMAVCGNRMKARRHYQRAQAS